MFEFPNSSTLYFTLSTNMGIKPCIGKMLLDWSLKLPWNQFASKGKMLFHDLYGSTIGSVCSGHTTYRFCLKDFVQKNQKSWLSIRYYSIYKSELPSTVSRLEMWILLTTFTLQSCDNMEGTTCLISMAHLHFGV